MSVSVAPGYQLWSYHAWYTVFSVNEEQQRVYYASEQGLCSWVSFENLLRGVESGTHRLQGLYNHSPTRIKKPSSTGSQDDLNTKEILSASDHSSRPFKKRHNKTLQI